MTYEEIIFLLLGVKCIEKDILTKEQKDKFFKESFKIIEKTLDKNR